MTRKYDPRVRTAAGSRQRLRDRTAGMTTSELVRMVQTAALLACLDGRHHAETDPDTGDEVCRYCDFGRTES